MGPRSAEPGKHEIEAAMIEFSGGKVRAGQGMADRGRFQVQLFGAGVFPTGDSWRAVTRVRYRSVQFDSSLGIGAGFRARLTGPLGVGLEAVYTRPGWRATAEFPNAGTIFHGAGKMDQKMIAMGLDLPPSAFSK